MTKKYSDFKITSIIIISVLIFFTLTYFRLLPLTMMNINISNYSNNFQVFYFILTEVIAFLLSAIFILSYSKKNDKELKKRYKNIGIGIFVLIFYFIFPYLEIIPFKLFNVNPSNIPKELEIIYLIAYCSLMAAITAFIYNKKLSSDWKKFKKNNKEFFSKGLKPYLISLFVMLISNLLIQTFVSKGIAGNEQNIREMFNSTPIYIFFSAVIYAPLMEELTFRLSIRKIFSNRWLFIIISGLLFGSLHVLTSFNDITDLLYIIPYSAPGFAFAYMLYKYDNICVPISFHLIHNGMMISLLTLLSIL